MQVDDAVRMGAMTALEVQRAIAARPVVLLPLGSHESHGPDLPMGDYLAAELIAVRIAQAAMAQGQPCLVAPVLPFGGADYFGSVPGGIALGAATIRAVIADIIGALLRHGIDRLVIINGHGGNAQPIHEVTLAVRRATGVIIPSFYLWKIARQLLTGLVGAEAANDRAGHGADPVASIAMHLFDLAAPTRPPLPSASVLGLTVTDFAAVGFQGVAIDMPLELDEIAPGGTSPAADPCRATAADGAALTDRLVALGAAFVLHHAAATPRPIFAPP